MAISENCDIKLYRRQMRDGVLTHADQVRFMEVCAARALQAEEHGLTPADALGMLAADLKRAPRLHFGAHDIPFEALAVLHACVSNALRAWRLGYGPLRVQGMAGSLAELILCACELAGTYDLDLGAALKARTELAPELAHDGTYRG